MEKINGGYILQPRCFDLSAAAHFPPCTRETWFYLLRSVNHTDNRKFSRGSGLFTLEEIQNALLWSVGYRVEKYSKPQLTKALRRLREENMIETAKATRGLFVTVLNYDKYQDPKNYEGNGEGNAKATRRQREGMHLKQEGRMKNEETTTTLVPRPQKEGRETDAELDSSTVNISFEEQNQKKQDHVPYKQIIDFLNSTCGCSYKSTSKATQRCVKARWNEGWSLKDFETVITAKFDEWGSDQQMCQYLRPETLFGTKFEGYLQNARNGSPVGEVQGGAITPSERKEIERIEKERGGRNPWDIAIEKQREKQKNAGK